MYIPARFDHRYGVSRRAFFSYWSFREHQRAYLNLRDARPHEVWVRERPNPNAYHAKAYFISYIDLLSGEVVLVHNPKVPAEEQQEYWDDVIGLFADLIGE